MQEYEQHLIGLGVKTGNQQSTRFHPYGKHKKKPRGRGAYQQGGFYPVPPPQYVMPPQFYPQHPQRGGFRGGHRGRGSRRGRGKSNSGSQNQQQTKTNDIPQFSPPLNRGQPPSTHLELHWVPNKPHVQSGSTCLPERPKTLSIQTPPEGAKTPCVQLSKASIYTQENIKRPPSGRQAKVVCKTMGRTGRSPISSRHPQTGLSPTIQGSSQAVQNTLHSQQIQRNRQRQCLVELYTRPPGQKRHRGSKQTRQSRILQSTVLSSQTREQMETRDRPQLPKPISNGLKIQDGNPRINPHIAQTRGMGHIDRSLRRIPSHSHSPTIKKVPQVPPQGNLVSIHQPTLWSGHGPSGLHLASEGSKAPSSKAGHSSTSVLRRLADKGLFPGRSSETHRQASLPDTKPRVYSKPTKVRTQPPAEVRLHRLPFFCWTKVLSDPQTTDGTRSKFRSTEFPRNLSSVLELLCPPLDYWRPQRKQ